MTSEQWIEHVDESIEKALRHQSWIDKEILDITGFATGTMRRMFSNLCHLPKANPVYCEVGLYAGATFCSAINNNETLTAFGFEDFSQDFGEDNIKEQFTANFYHYAYTARQIWHRADFFTFPKKYLPRDVDIFYLDANHAYQFQHYGIRIFFENMAADRSLIIVDDWGWSYVRGGTLDALAELKDTVTIEKQWVLSDGKPDGNVWHNDIALFLCSKIK